MNRSCGDRIVMRLLDLHPNCVGLAVNVFGYIIPILAVIVTTVNVLIVVIFTKPHIRSHTTFILTLIACVDIMDIICPAIVFVYHYMFGHYKEFLTCRQTEWVYILGEICVDLFNMFSLWLTVLLAFIRCRCIKSPCIARNIHSFKRIFIYIICIFMLVVSVHVPSFFLFDFKSVKTLDTNDNVTREICGILEPDGVLLKSCSRRKAHVLLETLLDSIIPCVVLVYFNFVILITLRKANQSRSSMRQNDPRHNKSHQEIQGESSRQACQAELLDKDRIKCMDNPTRKYTHILNCFKCENSYPRNDRSSSSSDHTLDKLDKESKRTSWLILVVSSIIVVHEIPFAVANTYALVTYRNVPLPISVNGCFSIVLLLWQFITYPVIFLIYACMSSAFRTELWKILTCLCNHRRPKQSNKRKSFLSPCSVRKTTPQENDAGLSHGVNADSDNVFDSESGSHTELELNTFRF